MGGFRSESLGGFTLEHLGDFISEQVGGFVGIRSLNLPVIFLTDRNDVRVGIRAIKAGAEDFFTKPVEREEFIGAIDRAISRHRLANEEDRWVRSGLARLERLTPRERQVFDRVVRGKMNKQIAYDLGTTERTIKAHRHKVMEKMQVRSVVELVTCAERLDLLRPPAPQEAEIDTVAERPARAGS